MNPFTPNHSTCYLGTSTTDAMKAEWANLAAKESEKLIELEENLERASTSYKKIMEAGTPQQKKHLEVYAPVDSCQHAVGFQKPLTDWVNIENRVCIAFFNFLDACPDLAARATAVQAAPILPQHSHLYTSEIQVARETYWLSLASTVKCQD